MPAGLWPSFDGAYLFADFGCGAIVRLNVAGASVDTRGPARPWGGPSLQPGASRDFAIAGCCGIPLDAVAVAANVTVANATTAGSLRIGPAGAGPALDMINFHADIARANNAILGLFGTPAGNVTVASGFSVGTADLVIDVTGWWR